MLSTPLVGSLTTMLLTATEGTAQVLTTCIARMGEETNPTVRAAYCAVRQIRTITQDGIQRELILTNKRTGAVVLVPILVKRENFREGYDKIARFSVKMLIGFCISSSYSLEAKASRCRARIFYALIPKATQLTGATVGRHTDKANLLFLPSRHSSADHILFNDYLGKRKPTRLSGTSTPFLLFQVVDPFS
jgi:hypothetical protein